MTDVCEFNQEEFCVLEKEILCQHRGLNDKCCAKPEDLENDFGYCKTCKTPLTDEEEHFYSGDCWKCYLKEAQKGEGER